MAAISRRRVLMVDAAIAGGVLVVGLAELSGVIPGSVFPGSPAVNLGFVLLTAAPLALRRLRPLTTFIAVATVTTVWQYALYRPDQQPPFEPFLALLMAVFTGGLATAAHRARAAVAVVTIGVLLAVVDVVAGRPIGAAVPPPLMIVGVFLLGRLMAAYRARAVAEGERAALLVHEAELSREEAIRHERLRIARDLHDVVSHDVGLIVLQASLARRLRRDDPGAASDALDGIESLGREALGELRRMLGVLRRDDGHAPLAPQPGLGQVTDLIAQARHAGVDVELVTEGVPAAALSPGVDITAYRVLQESLTNVAKHATAAHAVATIRHGQGSLEIDVQDDGAAEPHGGADGLGLGLVGMRERVAVHGGSLVAGRRTDAPGFRVLAHIPTGAA